MPLGFGLLNFNRKGSGTPGPDLTNGLAWMKADALITSSGGNISAWGDSFGNGNGLSQSGAGKPTLVAGALNGLPIVRFTAASSQSMTSGSWSLGGSTSVSFFVVCKERTDIGVSGIFQFAGVSKNTFLYNASGGKDTLLTIGGSGIADSASSLGGFHVISLITSGTASQMWKDGVSVGTATETVPPDNASNLILCADGSNLLFPDEDVAEIIIYKADKSAQRTSIESYLKTKWGL